MKKTITKRAAAAEGLVPAFLVRPWGRWTALGLTLGLAFIWSADMRALWGTPAYALGWGMGDAASCIRFESPRHNSDVRWPTNYCRYRVSVGYCLRTSADDSRNVLVRCSDGRMNTCGAAPSKQCHGGMQLHYLDSYSWGACRNGIANDDPRNFKCK